MQNSEVFDYSTFPTLKTGRLTLRELTLSDSDAIRIFRGDFKVQKYNGPVMQTSKGIHTLIDELRAAYTAQTGIAWGVTLTGQDTVFGIFTLANWNGYHRRAELGYDIARAYWGQGYASEAVRAIVRFGFQEMNLHSIFAYTIADNHESVRLLERVGFHREGTRREYSWEEDGTFHDSAVYGLLRAEFTSQSQ